MCVVGVGGRYYWRELVVGVVFGWFIGSLWVGGIWGICGCGSLWIWVSVGDLGAGCSV